MPDESFHENFVSEIIGEVKTNIHVLTGSPGLGKSTYLSYLCNELEDKKIPYIRHHYFISTSDRTQDRLSLRIIAESLYSQIRRFHHKINISSHEQPENLTNILENCGRYYKKSGKPFILIIDGLDHVWRDNNRNINPLDELFKTLLPLPDNLKIIVGTQPVDDEYLPKKLLNLCPKTNWTYLPPMSGNAILAYNMAIYHDSLRSTHEFLSLQRKVSHGCWIWNIPMNVQPIFISFEVKVSLVSCW
ncbi:MAG: ATP-binding protein [Acinetobacter johnsonii]